MMVTTKRAAQLPFFVVLKVVLKAALKSCVKKLR